jgi:hypothetical protein
MTLTMSASHGPSAPMGEVEATARLTNERSATNGRARAGPDAGPALVPRCDQPGRAGDGSNRDPGDDVGGLAAWVGRRHARSPRLRHSLPISPTTLASRMPARETRHGGDAAGDGQEHRG